MEGIKSFPFSSSQVNLVTGIMYMGNAHWACMKPDIDGHWTKSKPPTMCEFHIFTLKKDGNLIYNIVNSVLDT